MLPSFKRSMAPSLLRGLPGEGGKSRMIFPSMAFPPIVGLVLLEPLMEPVKLFRCSMPVLYHIGGTCQWFCGSPCGVSRRKGEFLLDCGNDCSFSLDRRGELAYNDRENTKGGECE